MQDAEEEKSADASRAGKLWGGRFTGALDPLMVHYNESLRFDKALYSQDIAGSIAYARANVWTGILTEEECRIIESAFDLISKEWRENKFVIHPGVDEDIHTANERRLGEIIGKQIAGKLHTGRSRNDQVATDLRLWLRDKLRNIASHLCELLEVFANRAKHDIDYLMPGYTHLQRAQPIRWSQWLLCYSTFLSSDLERLKEVIKRVNRSPLGCGALAGNAFGINRKWLAHELGFDGVIPNSIAAVSDRDFILETMQWSTMLMLHLSRFSEDLIIYGGAEFGFIRLADAYSTGSSLMPQKKNSDSLELIRGKCGRVFGQATGLAMTIKSLPLSYNKDLQEAVEPLLEQMTTVRDSIRIAGRVLDTLTVFPDRMRAALTTDMLATDLAEYLVDRGIPFRETHDIAGQVVALAEKQGRPMDKLSLDELREVDSRFESDVSSVWEFETSVERKDSDGGTSKRAVLEQIKELWKIINSERWIRQSDAEPDKE